MNYYTYAHYLPDGKIFYIGKGKGLRYKSSSSGRSKYWRDVIKDGYDAKILAYWPTEDEALLHERFLILCFSEMGMPLVNRTTGGQRGTHSPITEETRVKIILGQRRINARRLTDLDWDTKIHQARSNATKNRKEGYQTAVGEKFKERLLLDSAYAAKVSKSRAKAQRASVAVVRLKSTVKAEKILAMRADGKKYSEILKEVDCSIGFVSKVVNDAKIS